MKSNKKSKGEKEKSKVSPGTNLDFILRSEKWSKELLDATIITVNREFSKDSYFSDFDLYKLIYPEGFVAKVCARS